MTKALTRDSIQDLLQGLCARNVPCDVYRLDGEFRVAIARARFVESDDQCVIVDEPKVAKDVILDAGESVTVFFRHRQIPHAFETRVLERRVRVLLNEAHHTVGMVLQTPSRIERRQRRDAYRVPLPVTGMDCQFGFAGQAATTREDLHDPPLDADIEDLSVTGARLRLDTATCQPPLPDERLYLQFALPDGEMIVTARVRFVQPATEGGMELGIAFEAGDDPASRERAARLQRYLVEQERQQLRRRK